MKIEKKVIASLHRCYALGELTYKGEHCFLASSEREGPCLLFSEDGTNLGTVMEGEGGVMTLTPVPGTDGQFLSTQGFYSPNDSKNARIVLVTPNENGKWEIRTLCSAPFVHRFGILRRAGVNYLIVCCLKSGHEYRNDWRFKGACYGAVLPDDLSSYNDSHLLPLKLIKSGMLRNHGYSKVSHGGHDAGLVGCEEGTFLFDPPAVLGGEWTVTKLLDVPSSDSVLMDFDGDGKPELGCISPFHGSSLVIYHLDEFDRYVPCWKYSAPETDTEMIHGTWACTLLGRPTWIVGWRKGTMDTIAITWDDEARTYRTEFIDRNAGCANALHFIDKDGKDIIVAANHSTNEAACYTVTE